MEAGASSLGGVFSTESSERLCLLEEVWEEEWARPSGEAGIFGQGRFRSGNVEIVGWDQIRKALNATQGVPTLGCRYWVTSGELGAQQRHMSCLFPLSLWR